MSLTPGGYIVGKPKEVVTAYEFSVIASAPFAEPVTVTFKISVGITFSSMTNLADGEEQSEYFGVVSASGTSKVKYSLKSGSKLPDGLTLSANGEISGTPTKPGIYVFTIVAEAEGKLGDEITLTLFIQKLPATNQGGLFGGNTAYIPRAKREEI